MSVLANKIQFNNYEYDLEIEKFIEKTYKKVTIDQLDNDGQLVNYGPFTSTFFAPNNSIIIGIRFEDTYDLDKMIEQSKIYMDIKPQIEKDISKKLGYNVTVLKYDSKSVKKKINSGAKSK
jgi:hypothetical protein